MSGFSQTRIERPLNIEKPKFSIFQKINGKDDLPLTY